MASDVDIANLALSRLGDAATVASLDPPEGSAQAGHCARWFPMVREMLLEMHAWGFATVRASLAPLATNPATTWAYAYVVPADCVKPWAVLGPDAPDDYSVSFPPLAGSAGFIPAVQSELMPSGVAYTPQDFAIETDNTGARILYTNQSQAVLRYTRRITDPTRFTPLFVDAFAWLLASYLAGPIIKGDAGAAAGQKTYQMFQLAFSRATESESNARQKHVAQRVPWIAGR